MSNILFLCTGNSCRSQMAEGLAKNLLGSDHQFYSAGIVKHGINPRAVKVMKEIDIDISKHTSNTLDEFRDVTFDLVLTLCSDAHETCPVFNQGKVVHMGFEDPPRLTKEMENEEDILAVYSRVRDEIKEFLLSSTFKEHIASV